jgi:ribosomal protein S18 acetylase RimI-like enzyme
MAFTVRVARAADVEAIAALHLEVQKLHYAAEPQEYKPPSQAVARDLVDTRMAYEPAQYFVAESEGGQVVGYLWAVARQGKDMALTHARSFVEVEEACVSPPYRRRGVARLLLERAEQWARERALFEVRLTVRAFNDAARQAYAALGYEPIQHRMRRMLPRQG